MAHRPDSRKRLAWPCAIPIAGLRRRSVNQRDQSGDVRVEFCRNSVGEKTSEVAFERTAALEQESLHPFSCTDPVDFTSSLHGWEWELTRLERGQFRARGLTLQLGALSVARLSFNRTLLHRIRSLPGHVSVLLFGGSTGALFVEGHKLAPLDGVMLNEESASEIVSQGECVVFAISMSEASWRRVTRLWQHDGAVLRGRARLLAFKSDSVAELLNGVDRAFRGFAMHLQYLTGCGSPASLREHVLARFREVGTEPEQLHVLRRGRTRRRIGVERARDYIASHLADPIHLSDLCRHSQLEARSLEYGFRETVGLSPVGYVKMMRLGEAHRQLLSRAGNYRSVSEIALDAGFPHLSQFAVDYKKLYMESPSVTQGRDSDQRPQGHRRRSTGALAPIGFARTAARVPERPAVC
jgi:AraC family transcriptional regulator, ethanolamine operon transcriptional activator